MQGYLWNWIFKSLSGKGALFFVIVTVVGCTDPAQEPSSISPTISNIVAPSNSGRILVVAHRSCWRLAPENSLAAMDKCIELGVDMLEIDVRKTKDGKLVVIHDKTVNRTTQHTGLVSNFTLDELTSFRLREGAGGADNLLTKSYIPSLRQVLSHLKGRVLINLDVKESIRDATLRVVNAEDMSGQVIVKAIASSPEAKVLKNSSYLNKRNFMPIVKPKNGSLFDQISSFEKLGLVAFEVIYKTEPELQQACSVARNQNARCWVNTMWESLSPGHSDEVSIEDPDNHWGHLVKLGVDMFQTDRPKELVEYLTSKGLR